MLTNKLNLPEPFLRAAERASYSKGDARYSVTELIKPARAGALDRLYRDTLVEDVADQMPSLVGRMFHLMLEQAGAPGMGAILEERLYAEVDGVKISGAMDHTLLWEDGLLDDYKSCTTYAVMRGGKWEWEAQLNIYRWLRALHGQSVSRLRVIAWMKDFMLSRAIAAQANPESKYPQHEIMPIDIPVWDLTDTERYVRERVAAHVAADEWAKAIEGDPAANAEPYCTDEERWRSKIEWAIVKEGNTRATKKVETEAEANFLITQMKGDYRVEPRGGIYKRCLMYCGPGRAGLCSQWEAEKRANPLQATVEVDTSAFD